MILNLPNWINLLFVLTTIVAIVFFYYSNGKPKKLGLFVLIWAVFQSTLAYNGFYENPKETPQRFLLVVLPMILLMIYGLTSKHRHQLLKMRNTKISTFLHVVRIPVEIVLLHLFLNKMLPELATFEGRNFDILAGITAPIIGFLYLKNLIGKKILLIWNVICLVLVFFILANGLLSIELPFQQFGFEQPNRGMLYFPFVLLPSVVVPIVIYTHIVDILKLLQK